MKLELMYDDRLLYLSDVKSYLIIRLVDFTSYQYKQRDHNERS